MFSLFKLDLVFKKRRTASACVTISVPYHALSCLFFYAGKGTMDMKFPWVFRLIIDFGGMSGFYLFFGIPLLSNSGEFKRFTT
jgi:hypothetical protein